MSSAALVLTASFLASAVEAVEALTIVLAVGLTNGWRTALLGVAAGSAVLLVLVIGLVVDSLFGVADRAIRKRWGLA